MGEDTNVRIPGSEENWRPPWRLAKTECFFRCSFSMMSMVRGGACVSEDKVYMGKLCTFHSNLT